MPGTQAQRWAIRGVTALAVLLYLGSFALPDYRSYWTGGGPGSPGVADDTYFFSEMACTPPREWRDVVAASDGWALVCNLMGWRETGWWWSAPLDAAGWWGHVAVVAGIGLSVTGRGRGAVLAAVLAVGFGLARQWVIERNESFAGGYYLWLASMVAVGFAGVLRRRAEVAVGRI